MNDQTIEKMRTMKLFGMVRDFRTSLESGKTEKCTVDDGVALITATDIN